MVIENNRDKFPNLHDDFQITSPPTNEYNCLAWAVNENDRWWEASVPGYYWPEGAPTDGTIIALQRAYELNGFVECPSEELEVGFEKIALFENEDGEYSHASRQLSNGKWTSKLGYWEDIEHLLRALEGPHPAYGRVVKFMKRRSTRPQ